MGAHLASCKGGLKNAFISKYVNVIRETVCPKKLAKYWGKKKEHYYYSTNLIEITQCAISKIHKYYQRVLEYKRPL